MKNPYTVYNYKPGEILNNGHKCVEGFMEIGSIIGGLLDRYKVVFYLGIGILHKRLTCLS